MIPNSQMVKIGENITIQTSKDTPTRTYKMENGRIVGMIDGKEAMQQAVYKILATERFENVIYSWRYGVELKALFGKSSSAVRNGIKRVIKEALLADSRITDVNHFDIKQNENKRTVTVQFTVETVFGEIVAKTEIALPS